MRDWTFDEGSASTAADSSSLGNNGTPYNGTNWTTGRFGNAVNLNGSSAYVAAGVNQLPAADAAQSFSWWMNVSAYSGGNAIACSLPEDLVQNGRNATASHSQAILFSDGQARRGKYSWQTMRLELRA